MWLEPPGGPLVWKLNADGSGLLDSAGLGSYGRGTAIALDAAGGIYVTGITAGGSSTNPFPVTPGALQPALAGSGDTNDAFVAKLAGCAAPTIMCPANAVVETGQSTDPSAAGAATAGGSCSAQVSHADAVTAGSCPANSTITRTWTAVNASGQTASCDQIVTVQDTTPPTIMCPANVVDATDPGACSASSVAVGVPTTSDDGGVSGVSGVRSDGLAVDDDYPRGLTTITWSATDSCGHASACAQTVTVNDTEAPTLGACPAGGTYLLNSGSYSVGPIAASDNCALNAGASTLMGTVATSSVGAKNVTFTAVDSADASVTKNCAYSVIYDFDGAGGFQSPIDDPPTLNTAKAGSTIPIKWQMPDGQGGFICDVSAVASIQFQRASCTNFSSSPADPIETTDAAGNSGLRCESGQYVYNWKTSNAQSGKCYASILTLNDGTQHRANFFLK